MKERRMRMEIQRISLEERMESLRKGEYAHPEYVSHAIQSLAEIPLSSYLASHEEEWETVRKELGLSEKAVYRDAAIRIKERWLENRLDVGVAEMIIILALPFWDCYEERKVLYGKGK